MQINIDYDASVNNAPSGFEAGVQAAVQYLDSEFTNPVTLTIDVGYGEVDGRTLGANDLGESFVTGREYVSENYSAVRNALLAENAPGSSTLPTTSPLSGILYMWQAEAKALGLPQNNVAVDAYVGFSSQAGTFSYTNGSTPPPNEYYFVGVVEHEITEDMGRVSLIGDQPSDYSLIDLFRDSSPGVRDLASGSSGGTAYFSTNNGNTNLGTWNNDPNNGDFADWYPSGPAPGGNDAVNDYSSPGVINEFSQSDITLMEALGWSVAASPNPQPQQPVTVAGQIFLIGDNQTDPISSFFSVSNPGNHSITQYLFEDLGGTGHFSVNGTAQPDNQVITVSANSLGGVDFVGGAPGTDTLQVGVYDATTNSDVWSSPFTATSLPESPGNLEEWIMANGQYSIGAAPGSIPGDYQAAAIANFTGNGTDDILWQSPSSGDVAEWIMSNAGWAGSVDFGTAPAGLQIAGAGNFFGSNAPSDVLWFNPKTGETDLWEMASGHWAASVNIGTIPGSGWQVAGIGDFTGNGTDDILWHNTSTGDVAEWVTQNGHWAESVDFGTAPGGLQIAGAGHFFGSNAPSDVLWFNPNTGETDLWEMANGHWAASVNIGTIPGSGWQVAGIGDFAGNGTDDILWHNTNTGDFAEWLIQGGHWAGSVDFGNVPGWNMAGNGAFINGNGTSDILWHAKA